MLDDDIYDYIINNNIKLQAHYDKTIKNCYIEWSVYLGKINGKYRNTTIKLHRFITNCPKGLVVDHINRNPADNRRSNLRICTQFENNKNRSNNTSGITGVTWHSRSKKWRATIKKNGKQYELGEFKDKDKAIQAGLKAEQEFFRQ